MQVARWIIMEVRVLERNSRYVGVDKADPVPHFPRVVGDEHWLVDFDEMPIGRA